MSNVRRFWLINSLGERYDFTEKNSKVFLNQPSGFGFLKQFTTSRSGNEEEILDITYNMPSLSGELLFYQNSNSGKYQEYQNFIQFAKHRPLKFYYQTPNTFDSWFIDCEISQIDKSEVSIDGILHCPIVIKGNSFWKTAQEYDLAIREQITGGKVYPYTYPYTYEGNTFAHIDLNSNGTMETGFRFEIDGEITNPVLSIYQKDENNEDVKYGEIRLNGTFDKIKVDTRDGQESIYLEHNGSTIANPTSYFDLSSNGQFETPFPKLRVGDNILTFSYSGVFSEAIHIKWRDLFSTI